MAISGRKVRWSRSTDGGTTYVPFAGSTSDGLTINNEMIDATDKDDNAWRTLLDDIGVQSIDGTITMYITNVNVVAAMLDSPTTRLHDLKCDIDGLFDITGEFAFTGLSLTGAEGAEAATQEVTVMSSGAMTYAAAA